MAAGGAARRLPLRAPGTRASLDALSLQSVRLGSRAAGMRPPARGSTRQTNVDRRERSTPQSGDAEGFTQQPLSRIVLPSNLYWSRGPVVFRSQSTSLRRSRSASRAMLARAPYAGAGRIVPVSASTRSAPTRGEAGSRTERGFAMTHVRAIRDARSGEEETGTIRRLRSMISSSISEQ